MQQFVIERRRYRNVRRAKQHCKAFLFLLFLVNDAVISSRRMRLIDDVSSLSFWHLFVCPFGEGIQEKTRES